MYNPHDTICAIATAPGESALAIVRMSGKDSKKIAEKLFRGAELSERRATFGEIRSSDDALIDEVIAIWYIAPQSYSGEDMVEIICHGGRVVPQQIFSLCSEQGARMAEKGEFTLRAFLNGRLDLTEAEAVVSIISAQTSRSKRLAMNNLEGKLKRQLDVISSRLVELITILEAEVDFTDDEVAKLSRDQVEVRIDEIRNMLHDLTSTYDIGRIAEGRVQVAIVGAPNVGKSSLFNAILKTGRAIVTDAPGTTRDYISEYVNIGGYPVILTDTAGIRAPDGVAEEIGVDRSRELIEQSDLCLFVIDCAREIKDEDITIDDMINGKPNIMVVNKIDLPENYSAKICSRYIDRKAVRTSAKTGDGIDALLDKIREKLNIRDITGSEGVILSQRQFDCAQAASKSLKCGADLLARGESEEIYIAEIREALDQISMITGRITNDDILNRIFSEFCIGK